MYKQNAKVTKVQQLRRECWEQKTKAPKHVNRLCCFFVFCCCGFGTTQQPTYVVPLFETTTVNMLFQTTKHCFVVVSFLEQPRNITKRGVVVVSLSVRKNRETANNYVASPFGTTTMLVDSKKTTKQHVLLFRLLFRCCWVFGKTSARFCQMLLANCVKAR